MSGPPPPPPPQGQPPYNYPPPQQQPQQQQPGQQAFTPPPPQGGMPPPPPPQHQHQHQQQYPPPPPPQHHPGQMPPPPPPAPFYPTGPMTSPPGSRGAAMPPPPPGAGMPPPPPPPAVGGPQMPGSPSVHSPGSPPANAAAAAAAAHPRRRHYPQTQQVGYDLAGGAPMAPNNPMLGGQPGVNQPPQFFVPGDTSQMTPAAAAAPTYPQQPIGPGVGGMAQPQQPDMAALQGQFNQMNLQPQQHHGPQQPYNVTIDGVQPDVAALNGPPPTIRLPPRSSVTPSPDAVCSPDYCRSTVNAIPATASLAKKTKLPLGLLVTPHKTLTPQEPPVPTINEITRCRRCRTYINPYVQFLDDGRRWKCNLCYVINDVPHFFDYNVNEQRMINRWERAELNCAVVDYIAPSEYMVRPPQPPVFIFVIDVSAPAVQAGVVAAAASTLLACLDRIPNNDKRAKFGLITVDTALHFYSLKAEDPEPRMLVVSDLDDVFIPQPEDLLVNIETSKTAIENLLKKLPDMFKNNHAVGNALGPALQAAFKLVSPIGGKIVVLQSSLPTLNEGALKLREDPQMLGTSKESALLSPAAQFYKSFAVDCSRVQVCIDMFMFSSQYTDIATLNCLPKFTGGQSYYYPGFNASRREDAEKFEFEFNHYLESEFGLEAVLRLRASRGVRMTAFHGNFFLRSMDLLALPSVTPDHCYGVEFTVEEDITTPLVGFQTAVLHTSCHGERRIRVVTLVLPVVSTVSEMYASADQIAISSLLAKKAIERSISSKLEDAREALNYKCIDIVNTYKTELTASASGAAVHLQLCDNLKLIPLLTLALQKHVALRGGSQVPSDLRSYAMNLLYTMPPELLIPYVYPRLYALHLMPPEVGTINADGVTIMPSSLNLSSERLDRGGAFLLDDGQVSMIWLGRDVSPQLLQDLFGVASYEAVRGGKTTLPTIDHDFSCRVKTVLAKLRQEKRNIYYPHLYVVKEDGEPALRLWFLSHLIEDRTGEQPAYPMWLAQIREKINSGSY